MDGALCPLCGTGSRVRRLWLGPSGLVRCRQCGLVFRHLRPGDVEVGFETVEEEWLGERRALNFRRFLDRWVGPPGRLLDVGCGPGRFLSLARDRGWEVTGVDISPVAVRYAQKRFGVNALCGDLKGLRFPDHTFSLVTLWDVLDFVPDPLGLLQEVHRVLEPGGHLFIRVPNFVFQRLSYLLTWWTGRAFNRTFVFHFTSFAPAPLRRLLERSGFVVLRIGNSRPTLGDPYQAFAVAERLVTAIKMGVHALAQGLYLLSAGRWVLGSSLEAYARWQG